MEVGRGHVLLDFNSDLVRLLFGPFEELTHGRVSTPQLGTDSVTPVRELVHVPVELVDGVEVLLLQTYVTAGSSSSSSSGLRRTRGTAEERLPWVRRRLVRHVLAGILW